MIYEYFTRTGKSHQAALEAAAMYGATETEGHFNKAICVKSYDEDYNKLPSYFECPSCGGHCYNPDKPRE